MNLKTCIGCATGGCIISHNSLRKAKTCPCINCVVKPVCLEPCKKFNFLVIQLFPNIETWRNNYKTIRCKQVLFPCRADGCDIYISGTEKGRLNFGSIVTNLKREQESTPEFYYYRPSNNLNSNLYFEID